MTETTNTPAPPAAKSTVELATLDWIAELSRAVVASARSEIRELAESAAETAVDALAETVAQRIDASDVAEHVDVDDVAHSINAADLAEGVAEHVDVRDVAHRVGRAIATADFAELLSLDDVVRDAVEAAAAHLDRAIERVDESVTEAKAQTGELDDRAQLAITTLDERLDDVAPELVELRTRATEATLALSRLDDRRLIVEDDVEALRGLIRQRCPGSAATGHGLWARLRWLVTGRV